MPFLKPDGTLGIRMRLTRPTDSGGLPLFAKIGTLIQPTSNGTESGIANRNLSSGLIQLKASPVTDDIFTVTGTLIQPI
jgi:hypothetical protein